MSEQGVKRAMTAAGVAFTLLFCLAPFAFMAVVSLAARPEFLAADSQFRATLANYRDVLTDKSLHFPRYLLNSMIVSLASAAITVSLASLAAYAITRLPLAGKMYLLFAVLTVAMFPQIGIVGYLFKLVSLAGWFDTYQALVLPYVAWTLPLSLWILVGYFAEIPRELDAAALVDGCSRWQILLRVILPVAAPGVLSVFLLAFIFAFNEFMFALMLTGERARTVPVAIAMFQGLYGQIPWGSIMAASMITTLPVVAITLAFQRRIISGLTHGAVKG